MRRLTRAEKLTVIAIVVLLVTALLLPGITAWRITTDLCLVCGSLQRQTFGPFGFRSAAVVENSPLADWLAAHGKVHEHRWKHLSTGGSNIFGGGTFAGSVAISPKIYFCREHALTEFVARASPAEIMDFVHVMETGEAKQHDDAAQQLFNRYEPNEGKALDPR